MNIQDFSERTGVSKSALRYYEEKKLLVPRERSANGYRVYAEDQIATVKLISSLRLADVPIKDIQVYLLESDEAKRQLMLDNWITNIRKTRNLLDVSLRYLKSDSFNKEVYLIEKSAEYIIWYPAESKKGQFKEHFLRRRSELQKRNIQFKNCYLKYVSGEELIKVLIGFAIPANIKTSDFAEASIIEEFPKCVCITMPFKDSLSTIQNGYNKLMSYAVDNNWTPISPILEWYHGVDFAELDLLMPVTQMERRRE